ncbi:hypothetical protein Dsin_022491 [Dipteronia sinensis]|uniref:PLAT domain-containing protein n=1 Tax=Dipteronia sinensis TaxID=43782 RepID=A0AAE0DZZ6_9ROSI|nr:hypothetical protein Dsin_022491 [Dipteronia sinensis]
MMILKSKPPKVRVGFSTANNIKAVATPSATVKSLSVKVVVTVKQTAIDKDDIQDRFGKSLLLVLVSAQLDPRTEKVGYVTYEAEFEVSEDFGEVGAILVENEHHKEMFLTDVVLDGFPNGPITISCNSWVQSKHDNKPKRVFFTNKVRYSD